jgi:hypothetical protein
MGARVRDRAVPGGVARTLGGAARVVTGLFGWVPARATDVWPVLAGMGCALRAHATERWAVRAIDGIGIGVLDGVTPDRAEEWAEPILSDDAQHALWIAGEIFEAGAATPARPQDAAGRDTRRSLLRMLIDRGPSALAAIDGEFQIAWWDRRQRTLTLIGDRFGGLPWYWSRTSDGVAFACGVRGVLMAPGVSATPDGDALRDAVTFGGYRLGTRTNVEGVRMFPGATVATIASGAMAIARWWRWTDLQPRPDVTLDAAIEGAHERWQRAIGRRLRGALRPGQTLSGGFDSRAILAEAAPRAPQWTAITYGVPGCEDARYARAAAGRARARWLFQPLYEPGWLEMRRAHVQQTDGLIQLVDLLHGESLPLQCAHLDVHLSGYIGDAVAGPTFNDIRTPEDALLALPYYETPISRGFRGALDRVAAETDDASWRATRWAVFEHKLPQSTNRWSAAWRPWLRVRKPFTDYEFFDFCQSLPAEVRGPQRFYERWLRRNYPALFARIPAHKSGVPAAASPPRVALARAARLGRRAWLRAAEAAGWPHAPWSRAFHDEHRAWSAPAAREVIQSAILHPASVAVALWGRPAVAGVIEDWFAAEHGPTQVIGALYTFEAYHAGLASHLADAAAEARRSTPAVRATS